MRRLAILFAILAAVSTVEHIVLPGKLTKVVEAPRRIRRALISLADWRAFLIGPLRLFQRTAARTGRSCPLCALKTHGSGPWLGQSN